MFQKKCNRCEKIGWFWQSGWHFETPAEAEQRERRNPHLMHLKARLQSQGTPLPVSQETYCRDCIHVVRGYLPATKAGSCGKCKKAVAPKQSQRLAWYDGDQAGWYCYACKAISCGVCATVKLQELKVQYRAAGFTLKTAIDSDRMAIYGMDELSPRCSQCNKPELLLYGTISE